MKINNIAAQPFNMKFDSAAARRVLEKADPIVRRDIYNGLQAFCDTTQKRGIKGPIVLRSYNNGILKYSILPNISEKAKVTSIEINENVSKSKNKTRAKKITQALFANFEYLFK